MKIVAYICFGLLVFASFSLAEEAAPVDMADVEEAADLDAAPVSEEETADFEEKEAQDAAEAVEEEKPVAAPVVMDLRSDYLKTRKGDGDSRLPQITFTIGTRALYMSLLDDKKGRPFENSFIGSIHKLEADQNMLPIHPYVQATAAVGDFNLGLGFTYSYFKVSTRDNGGGDGAVKTDALSLYAIASYSAPFNLTPFVEAGVGMAMNSFDAFSDWSEGGKREFDLDDSTLFYVGGGIDYAVMDHWLLNVYVRYMTYDVDGEYIYRGDSRPAQSFTFPLEHIGFGVGLAYAF